jgi:hypothetical protein
MLTRTSGVAAMESRVVHSVSCPVCAAQPSEHCRNQFAGKRDACRPHNARWCAWVTVRSASRKLANLATGIPDGG